MSAARFIRRISFTSTKALPGAPPMDAAGLDTRQMRWGLDYTAQQSAGTLPPVTS